MDYERKSRIDAYLRDITRDIFSTARTEEDIKIAEKENHDFRTSVAKTFNNLEGTLGE
jgi:hypothetical protein